MVTGGVLVDATTTFCSSPDGSSRYVRWDFDGTTPPTPFYATEIAWAWANNTSLGKNEFNDSFDNIDFVAIYDSSADVLLSNSTSENNTITTVFARVLQLDNFPIKPLMIFFNGTVLCQQVSPTSEAPIIA